VEPLIQALKDEDSGVRSRTAGVLGDIGDARAVEPLVQASSKYPGMAFGSIVGRALDKIRTRSRRGGNFDARGSDGV